MGFASSGLHFVPIVKPHFNFEILFIILGGVDPIRDIEIINTELILNDLQTVENAMSRIGYNFFLKKIKKNKKKTEIQKVFDSRKNIK